MSSSPSPIMLFLSKRLSITISPRVSFSAAVSALSALTSSELASRVISCQSLFTGFHEVFGPPVVHISVNAFTTAHSSAMLSSPRRPSSTIRIFSSAEYFLRVCSVYLSPSFLLFVLSSSLPLGVNDELKLSLTQLAYLVHIVLTGYKNRLANSNSHVLISDVST